MKNEIKEAVKVAVLAMVLVGLTFWSVSLLRSIKAEAGETDEVEYKMKSRIEGETLKANYWKKGEYNHKGYRTEAEGRDGQGK